jgi:hypothetical protein
MYHRREGSSRDDAYSFGFVARGHGGNGKEESLELGRLNSRQQRADEANYRRRFGGLAGDAAAEILL